MRLRALLGVLMAALMCLGLSACAPSGDGGSSPGSSATQGEHVQNLVIGTYSAIETKSIMSQSGAFGKFNYNSIVYANFFYPDAENNMHPYFLDSFEISDDAKQIDMTFPTTAVWHDGQPVTVDDVVFTWEYRRDMMKSKALKNLTEVRANGDNSVSLIFSEPDAYYVTANSALTTPVMPKHIWEGVEDSASYDGADAAIGCGPYKLVGEDFDAGTLSFEAVPENAFLGDLTVDAITLKTYSTQDAVLMALANGEIDAMYDYATPVPPSLLDVVNGNSDIDLGQSDYAGMNQVTFGAARGPNTKLDFREATVRALNWDLLAQVVNGEYGKVPGRGVVSPVSTGFDSSIPKMYQDVDEANKMLDEQGYADTNGDGMRETPDGSELKYKVTSQFAPKKQELLDRISEVLVSSLRDVGIDAYYDQDSLASDEANMAMLEANDYDMFVGYTTTGTATYSTAIWYFLNRDLVGAGARAWGNSYQNDDLDAAYLRMRNAVNHDEYAAAVGDLQQEVAEQLPGFSVAWEQSFFPYRTDNYQGWENMPSIGVIHAETFYSITTK